ncbi:molybdate ABC transporter substrate-binding protein [Desulfovibrio sp. OttesenSCG-928-G11]|nr:molybdate ABC transporter substrate-binding protein [Desulfovibrio sp. OttesenSCG-928-G11]
MRFRKNRSLPLSALPLLLLCLAVPFQAAPAAAAGKDVLIFAAASATDAITEIGTLYEARGLGKVTASFASSSTLAKQIEQGAPADVFLSANDKWMDYLEERQLLAVGSRVNLLRNRIVLIVPADSPAKDLELKAGLSLLPLLGADGRLAVGDPEHVPVGMYGKKALENLGMWQEISDRLAPAKDVRAGLALVERAEAPLGLVYESDAVLSGKARIIGVFPENSHPKIVYPVAAVAAGELDAAGELIKFLLEPEARAIFKKYGFAGM